jgi:hypothetical protein
MAVASVRAENPAITSFDAPGGAHGTYAVSINVAGEVTGYFFDANYGEHGFVRDRRGSITTFDGPNATATVAQGINAEGEIVGFYTVGSADQGFLRSRDGTITTLTLPDGTPLQGQSINAAGEISGSYVDSAGGVSSRPERSAVEGPAVSIHPLTKF